MTTLRADVKPELLRWARESLGLTLEDAAAKFGVNTARLLAWESGSIQPTVAQLRTAANVYKRPLAVFFLPEPPTSTAAIHDYRRLPGEDEPTASPGLRLEIRRARRRRVVALDLAHDLGIEIPKIRLSASIGDDPDRTASLARQRLLVSLATQQQWTGEYEPLTGWIGALESLGVLVFQASRVGVEDMRGFSLSEPEYPVIVLNGGDRPRARVFTLMHEFVHLLLNAGGVCDPLRDFRGRTEDSRIEAFCNRVAGAILVPADSLLNEPEVRAVRGPQAWSDADIGVLAERYSVSREVLLRRLLVTRKTSAQFYESMRSRYLAEYAALRARVTESSGGPSVSRLTVRNNGRRFTRLVLDAFEQDRISPADVADYLGAGLQHLDEIEREARSAIAQAEA